ncbi:MAG: hypothetical protein CM1200mP2_19960 [Planctomycetaceae bacterium]|nr:MAG: hypothetical protein CM1200mP2_19960 [Planctomycetaceae bacterium]
MDRRTFLKSGLGAGVAASLGTLRCSLPNSCQDPGPKLKVTKLKVIPVWTGSMNYIFVKLYTNAGVTGVGEGGIRGRAATMIAGPPGTRTLYRRQEPDADREALAGDVPLATLARWPDPQQRRQRRRHRPVGHRRQSARCPHLPVLGEPPRIACVSTFRGSADAGRSGPSNRASMPSRPAQPRPQRCHQAALEPQAEIAD